MRLKLKLLMLRKERSNMKFPILNIDGSKSEMIDISDKLVKLKVNYKLIKFVITQVCLPWQPIKVTTHMKVNLKLQSLAFIAEISSLL